MAYGTLIDSKTSKRAPTGGPVYRLSLDSHGVYPFLQAWSVCTFRRKRRFSMARKTSQKWQDEPKICGMTQNKDVFAYTDESGNTGFNLFDEQQPHFWTGTLLSLKDIEITGTDAVKAWCSYLGCDELHGNILGFAEIEKIASKIRYFVGKNDLRFVFTRIDKRYFLVTKFVDTLMDSHNNKAVSPILYSNKLLRLIVVHRIGQSLDIEDGKIFWQAYTTMDGELLSEAYKRFRTYVETSITDKRASEVIIRALEWGIKNPKPLLNATLHGAASPNVAAFALVFGGIRAVLKNPELRVTRFIHDQQNQFAKSMHDAYTYHKETAVDYAESGWPSIIKDDTFRCPLLVAASHEHTGLQLIDVLLWLTKRFIVDQGSAVSFPQCKRLLSSILSEAVYSDFSFNHVMKELKINLDNLMKNPLSEEDISQAHALIDEVDRQLEG